MSSCDISCQIGQEQFSVCVLLLIVIHDFCCIDLIPTKTPVVFDRIAQLVMQCARKEWTLRRRKQVSIYIKKRVAPDFKILEKHARARNLASYSFTTFLAVKRPDCTRYMHLQKHFETLDSISRKK